MAKNKTSSSKSPASPRAPVAKIQSANEPIFTDTPTHSNQEGEVLTTNQGVRISDNHNSLKAGVRGPTLLEDFVLREKITQFDHERIPERVVHARGAGAFGYFECLKSMKKYTSAGFLATPGKRTKVLTRFSTVAGSRGSADTARDVRGFATRFYTDEGNYDLVGNNIPVFFIQDAMKFPDLIHSVKPEMHNEIPQAASAHDTFWDFASLMPESTHMLMWVMSDRAIPRSYRMMEGFGVHTFRFVNEKGEGTFVKFHWKPKLGIHGVTWEEAFTLAGQDPDFHRRDLWDNINAGNAPVWELGVQLIPEADEFKYAFDLLDPTKLVPEDLVPVEIIGRMVLDRNPDNYFAQIEQVAFHPGNLVPGIDVTNDPLLQGRLFSYIDTQISRLGGPNFHEIPVNRPINEVHNHNLDGHMRQAVPTGRINYEPNSLGGGCPFMGAMKKFKTFISRTERVDGHKVRARSMSFNDHLSQAKLFFDSQTKVEQGHIRDAFSFELSKVETEAVRERMLGTLSLVNLNLAKEISEKIGVKIPANFKLPASAADADNNIVPENSSLEIAQEDDSHQGTKATKNPKTSDLLSMIKSSKPSLETRKFALLIADGVDTSEIETIKAALKKEGASAELVAAKLSPATAQKGAAIKPDKTFDNTSAFQYDGVFVLGGKSGESLSENGLAKRFVAQAYKQCKPIGGAGTAQVMIKATLRSILGELSEMALQGVVLNNQVKSAMTQFIAEAKNHRVWAREEFTKNLAV